MHASMKANVKRVPVIVSYHLLLFKNLAEDCKNTSELGCAYKLSARLNNTSTKMGTLLSPIRHTGNCVMHSQWYLTHWHYPTSVGVRHKWIPSDRWSLTVFTWVQATADGEAYYACTDLSIERRGYKLPGDGCQHRPSGGGHQSPLVPVGWSVASGCYYYVQYCTLLWCCVHCIASARTNIRACYLQRQAAASSSSQSPTQL